MSKNKFSKRLDVFPEYIFSTLAKKKIALELETGKKVLDLAPGIPDLRPSNLYVEKLKEFIDEPKSHYYPGYGAIDELSEALVYWYKQRFKVELSKNQLAPLLGGKDGVSHINLALLDAHDEVLVPDPGYPAYSGAALMVGAKPTYYSLTEQKDFKPDIHDILGKITSKTRFIWVNFPSNPTGQVADKVMLMELVNLARTKGIWLVYDNAYSEITFGNYKAPSILEIEGASDVAVEIGSFSKTFSFAGFRMGWIVGNSEVIAALMKIKSQIDSGLTLPLQKLGAFALTNTDWNWYENMLKLYLQRKEIICRKIKALDLEFDDPKGSLYIWAKIPDKYKNSEEFAFELLNEKHILVTPGTGFGQNGSRFVRISICAKIDDIDNYF